MFRPEKVIICNDKVSFQKWMEMILTEKDMDILSVKSDWLYGPHGEQIVPVYYLTVRNTITGWRHIVSQNSLLEQVCGDTTYLF